jgi:aspartyl-tRNA(Asn)/glutamyl-tRNA(Gln) amidotransferase subunit A
MDLHTLSLAQASRLLGEKKISSCELTRAFLARIDTHDPDLNCFVSVDASAAMAQAQAADQQIAAGNHAVFTGIPMAAQRPAVYKRDAHHLRIENSGKFCAAV